jgi:hypothetical protein
VTVIDHILLDVIGSLREALESSLLEQQAVEERFQVDVFLGDVSFATSYSLPGEGTPPRVRADISLDWPTWSQSAYRSWSIGEPTAEPPELAIEITLRIQRVASPVDVHAVRQALRSAKQAPDSIALEESGATLEEFHEGGLGDAVFAAEIAFQGTYRLEESLLEDPERLDADLEPLARFISSALVRLGDLDLDFLAAPGVAEPGP